VHCAAPLLALELGADQTIRPSVRDQAKVVVGEVIPTWMEISHMPRPQFTLRALLVAMLVVAAFFAGIRFERERQRRREDAKPWPSPLLGPNDDVQYFPPGPEFKLSRERREQAAKAKR
jgi:hypothetical protein